jgi:hypothetical protein
LCATVVSFFVSFSGITLPGLIFFLSSTFGGTATMELLLGLGPAQERAEPNPP